MNSEWPQNTDLLVPLTDIDFNPPLFEKLAAQGITIKRAAPADSSKILSFIRTEFSQRWCDEAAFALNHRNCWIAVDSGKLVGFIVVGAQAPDFVGPFGVIESHQGLGIAVALTIRAFEGLYHQGYRYVICGWVSYATYQLIKKHIASPIVLPGSAKSSYNNFINSSSVQKASASKTIYLTFDDGPSTVTPALLDILEKHEVKATFFITNKYKQPELIARIHKAKHTIGLHSYAHEYEEIYASDEAFFEDVERISRLVEEQTGEPCKLFRFPGGTSNMPVVRKGGLRIYRLISGMRERGYRIFDWNAESLDGMQPNLSAVEYYDDILRQIERLDDVVLLSHNRPEDAESVKSIDLLIEHCKARGYAFKTLDECADMPLHVNGLYRIHPQYRIECTGEKSFAAVNGETGKHIPLNRMQRDFLAEKCNGTYRFDEHTGIVDALLMKWAYLNRIIVPEETLRTSRSERPSQDAREAAAKPAAKNPSALRLAHNDPDHVPGVWRYRQTDSRYADERVGTLTFAQAGCGPCAIANIVDRNPAEILAWLNENGQVTNTNGIFWKGIPAALDHFGGNGELLCEERLSNEPDHPCFAKLKDHLRAGQPGIILMGPGDWTRTAHFVSAVGFCDKQDAVLLYDPMGEDRDGWYPWSTVIAQAQTCLIASTPQEDKYAPRYIFKQAFGTKLAGHEQYWPTIEHEVLARINPDYVGWIHLDASPINYPIVKERFQSQYYLTRNFSGEESCHGCVTLNFRHGGVFAGPNILLGAHDMRDGSMFAAILRYDEAQWSKEHPVIEIQLPNASYHANVFSAYPFNKKALNDEEACSPRAQARKTRFDSAEDLERWAEERVALSSHPFDVVPKRGDTFVTFITCNMMFGYDSFVAHAILKPVEKDQ